MTVRLSVRTWISLFVVSLAVWFTISYTALLLEITWIIFGAFLIGIAIRPVAARSDDWHIPRGFTVLLVYCGLIAAVAGTIVLAKPIIREEFIVMQRDGPALWQQVQSRLNGTSLGNLLPGVDTIMSEVGRIMSPVLTSAFDTLSTLGQFLFDLLMMMILAYFYATDEISGNKILGRWIPPGHQDRFAAVSAGLEQRLRVWVWAQLGMAILTAAVFGIALALMGVPFAWTIGLVSGLLSVIPYLGAIVATVLGMLSALTVSAWLAVWVLVFAVAFSVIESHLLAPVLYGRALGLRSVVVLMAIFVGLKMLGIVGLVFSVPLVVVITAVVEELHISPQAVESMVSPKMSNGDSRESA